MMRVVVIGTGYVGLVSGTCFAELGHHVVCIDSDQAKIKALIDHGQIPIYEKNLSEMVQKNQAAGRLEFACELSKHLNNSEVVMIAVGTPLNNHKVDLSYVMQCVEQIATQAKKDLCVIIKSTVPAGTCHKIQKIFDEKSKYILRVVSNPEFLREGEAVQDFLKPDRVVVGMNGDNDQKIEELYRPMADQGIKIFITDIITAELIKYASNTLLATKIAFINEMSDLSEELGANIADLARGVGMDQRIGGAFLKAGPGFGGSCFPKDIRTLLDFADDCKVVMPLVQAVEQSNDRRKNVVVKKIKAILKPQQIIAVLGITYKAGTDDVRCSPALAIVKSLLSEGFSIRLYDPKGLEKASKDLGASVTYCKDVYEAANGANLLLVLTEWLEFKHLDIAKLKKNMHDHCVYDLRGIIDHKSFVSEGFDTRVIGYR